MQGDFLGGRLDFRPGLPKLHLPSGSDWIWRRVPFFRQPKVDFNPKAGKTSPKKTKHLPAEVHLGVVQNKKTRELSAPVSLGRIDPRPPKRPQPRLRLALLAIPLRQLHHGRDAPLLLEPQQLLAERSFKRREQKTDRCAGFKNGFWRLKTDKCALEGKMRVNATI